MKRLFVTACCLFVSLVALGQNANPEAESAAQELSKEFFYVANFGGDTVSGFALDTSTGKAIEVPGSPFPTGIGPGPITHSPDGRFVYVAIIEQFLGSPCGSNPSQVFSYSIDPATGSLRQVDVATTPDFCASDIAIDPSGQFVYVALSVFTDIHGGAIAAYKTNGGHLTPVAGSPFASPIVVPGGTQPALGGLAISADGKVLYASDPNDANGILIFDRDTRTGALAFRETFNTGVNLEPIAITPSGKFLLGMAPLQFGSPGNGVYEYEIGAHGALKAVPGSPFSGPATSTADLIRVSPNGEFVVFAGAGIGMLRTSSRGELSSVPGSPFSSNLPLSLTFDPSGRFVIGPTTIFRVNQETGVLAAVSDFVPGNFPMGATAVAEPPPCAARADFTVNICSPAEDAKVSSPVSIVAAANADSPLTSMQIYLDGRLVFDEHHASEIDTDLAVDKGRHLLVVKAWIGDRDFSSSRSISVE